MADLAVFAELRTALDERGLHWVRVHYPLALPASLLRETDELNAIVAHFKGIDLDSIWLRLHPFGTTSSGPIALRGYIEACHRLHSIGVPLVAEHTGTVGVALMAYGAVSAIESGITIRERFDITTLVRPLSGRGFSPPPRVYLAEVGAFMKRDRAESFFAHRSMRIRLGCRSRQCSRGDATHFLSDPRRHFVVRRAEEVDSLGKAPYSRRAELYRTEFVESARQLAARAVAVDGDLRSVRERLESWAGTLDAVGKVVDTSFHLPEAGRRYRTTLKPQVRPQIIK